MKKTALEQTINTLASVGVITSIVFLGAEKIIPTSVDTLIGSTRN